MPGTLLQPVDIETLAARGQSLRESLSLTDLPRLVEALPAGTRNDQPVACTLAASLDEAGQVTLAGTLATRWTLICQRCLGEMSYDVDVAFRWTFRRDAESAFVLTDEPVRIADCIEDELLLDLPQIPTHADDADCGELVRRYVQQEEDGEAPPTRKPFADLKSLMDGRD